ncbi:Hypothetical protein PFR_JS21-2_1486 [Propionibacterium freudenreichii]|nr:Hypothetical protein PFR_JS4_1169 [Propionibacterium freudenreichii]SCQ56654.1 Hypothetical protein PFR_JS21-1_1487 [Propionibacterium freudenreichii]SCQ59050.1 Hypothetical protein PFR_JS25-1_1350 [Propionibacterium freudenreichii]SCQ63599.1 Hypothetical protein PFR_JS21-2_1486 [Propionibacterium freudenreichii]
MNPMHPMNPMHRLRILHHMHRVHHMHRIREDPLPKRCRALPPMRLPREQRRELVTYLAGEGMSTRAIARVVGTSRGTVAGDIQAGVQNWTPAQVEAPAARSVIGLDGHTYPAVDRARESVANSGMDPDREASGSGKISPPSRARTTTSHGTCFVFNQWADGDEGTVPQVLVYPLTKLRIPSGDAPASIPDPQSAHRQPPALCDIRARRRACRHRADKLSGMPWPPLVSGQPHPRARWLRRVFAASTEKR